MSTHMQIFFFQRRIFPFPLSCLQKRERLTNYLHPHETNTNAQINTPDHTRDNYWDSALWVCFSFGGVVALNSNQNKSKKKQNNYGEIKKKTVILCLARWQGGVAVKSRIKHEATIVLGELNCDILPYSKISVLHVYTNMFFKTLNNINLKDILKNSQSQPKRMLACGQKAETRRITSVNVFLFWLTFWGHKVLDEIYSN